MVDIFSYWFCGNAYNNITFFYIFHDNRICSNDNIIAYYNFTY